MLKRIKKNKEFVLSIVLFSCTFVLPAKGQKALDETVRRNVALEKEILLLEEETGSVNQKISELILQIASDSVKFKTLENDYNLLVEGISQDSIMSLSGDVDSLEQRHEALQSSIATIKQDIENAMKALHNAESELEGMHAFHEYQDESIYKSNKNYLTLRYSLMTLERLNEIAGKMELYNAKPDYSEYKSRVTVAINNKKIYDDAWRCVSSGDNYLNTKEIRAKLQTLLEIEQDNVIEGKYKLTTEQFYEVDSLDIKLSRVNSGIRELQNIVTKINSDKEINRLRNVKNLEQKTKCLEFIKPFVFPQVGSNQYNIHERYFKMIPFLEELLNAYWDELNIDPFDVPTKSEVIINDLIVK